MPCRFLIGFRETGTHSRACDNCSMSTLGSGRDNFIGVRAFDFLNSLIVFTSPVDVGYFSVNYLISI